MAQRLVAKAATPVVTYNVSGDEWTVLTTGLKDTTMKFKIGVEQDDETPDGRKVKVSHCAHLSLKLLTTTCSTCAECVLHGRSQQDRPTRKVGRQDSHLHSRDQRRQLDCGKYRLSEWTLSCYRSTIRLYFQTINLGDVCCVRRYKRV